MAPHYRELIYKLLEKELECDFFFGKAETSIRQLDLKTFKHAEEVPNIPIYNSKFYKMPGTISKIKDYDIIIDDMGIFCITSWKNLIYAKLRKQKVFMWSHGWYGREGFIKKWVKRLYSALSDGMLLYNNYAYKLMAENGFNTQKLHVIKNSLDYDKQNEIRKELSKTDIYQKRFNNLNPVLIFIGRLTSTKNIDMIIGAIHILKEKGLECNLAIIGDGTELRKLVSLSENLKVKEQVWFYGECYNEEDIARLIYDADLCISPGNVGLTAIHSMTYGCPCISHDNLTLQMPEFESIKTGKTGRFFEYGNVESLANSIKDWLDENFENREKIRENCFNEVENHWNPHKQLEIIKKAILK